jgi:transposase
VAWLKEVVHELTAAIARLEEENRSLRAQLNLSSRNSSKPPSSDPPGTEKPKRRPSGRKAGGQPGHEGKTRDLLPPEEVDHFVHVHPDSCGQCGAGLPRDSEDPAPSRHQVTEIPPVRPEVTEYQLHATTCPCCGAVTRAGLPDGVSAGAFGPRLTAVIAVLSGAYRMSKRNIEQVLSDLFGVKMALGSVVNLERAASEALSDRVEELRQHVRRAEVVHADETTWMIGGRKAWLWVAVTAFAAVFLIRKSRAAKVARELLGEAPCIVVSDRYSGYGWIPVRRRQVCWAHLIRDFQKIEDAGGDASSVGAALGLGFWVCRSIDRLPAVVSR